MGGRGGSSGLKTSTAEKIYDVRNAGAIGAYGDMKPSRVSHLKAGDTIVNRTPNLETGGSTVGRWNMLDDNGKSMMSITPVEDVHVTSVKATGSRYKVKGYIDVSAREGSVSRREVSRTFEKTKRLSLRG